MGENHTRRRVLKMGGIAATAGFTGGLSGCSSIPGLGGGGGSANVLSVVPGDASVVAYADIAGMLEDSAVETLVNTSIDLLSESPAYNGPEEMSGVLDQFENRSGLDPEGANEVVSFGAYPEMSVRGPTSDRTYGGIWFSAEWTENDVVSALEEQGMRFEENEYGDRTVYAPTREFSRTWLGILGDNEFVSGTEDAVKDTIDVVGGEAESVGSDLRNAYSSVRSGLFKAASVVPEDKLPDQQIREGGMAIDPNRIGKVEVGALTAYHDGNEVGTKAKLRTADTDTAEDVRNIVAGGFSTVENTVASDDLSSTIDSIEVSQNGKTVVISYAASVDTLTALIEKLVEEFGIGGAGGGAAV